MPDRAADQLPGLLRRLAARLNRKLADVLLLLLNHKSASSLGALAGFAIAVVFTWKLLRSPLRRGPPKRRDAPSSTTTTNRGAETSSGPEVQSPAPSTKELDTAELTAGQIVRRKLSGCRKMTCQLLGVILEETSPEDLQKHATVRPPVVGVLMEITKYCDLYLMETVLDDESEERILSALESAGLFQSGGLVKEKVLFCSTDIGRTSFVRQLEADWHIDTNFDITSQLARFIRYQLHISPNALGQIAPNVFTSTSLEQYFSCLG